MYSLDHIYLIYSGIQLNFHNIFKRKKKRIHNVFFSAIFVWITVHLIVCLLACLSTVICVLPIYFVSKSFAKIFAYLKISNLTIIFTAYCHKMLPLLLSIQIIIWSQNRYILLCFCCRLFSKSDSIRFLLKKCSLFPSPLMSLYENKKQ